MNEQAHNMLDLLHTTRWFVSVGQPMDSSVYQVKSWEEADARCAELDWENALIEARNDITSRIYLYLPRYPQEWNETVNYLTMIAKPMIAHKAGHIKEQYRLSESFFIAIRHSVIGMVMSAQFGHILLPTFHADLAYWYVNGHFPCGWEGDYPQGRLIVY